MNRSVQKPKCSSGLSTIQMHYGTDPIYIWGNTGSAIGKSSLLG